MDNCFLGKKARKGIFKTTPFEPKKKKKISNDATVPTTKCLNNL